MNKCVGADEMQECAGAVGAPSELREDVARDQPFAHHYAMPKGYGCSGKEMSDPNMATYCRVATGIYEATSQSQHQNSRYSSTAPTFSSPPNCPLVGLVFDPSSSNYAGQGGVADDRCTQSPWTATSQEPIGTGAKKKIVKSQDKRTIYPPDPRFSLQRYKEFDNDRQRKQERNLTSESTSSLDFFAEGERMVSELCNMVDVGASRDGAHKQNKFLLDDDKAKVTGSEVLLMALDKIMIHDQIPNEIVQLAIEACTDAENIAIAHHNRPCFKNIHSICAKTRSNVQKPDSAVANLHSQGIPWVIKNFIFSFVRILDGWKGVKELLSEKHDTFSRIENKYYNPNIRECFVQWQAVTKEMLTHIYKTFKCLDHGFTMEQKSFTHNYYATNSPAPRHQSQQNKFQQLKSHAGTLKSMNTTPQSFNAVQPPWVQNPPNPSHSFNEGPWPVRTAVSCKKFPVAPPSNSHNFYPLSDQSDIENFPKNSYKCDPCKIREAKPRQSWTISNVPDPRTLEGMCQADQRELYSHLKQKVDSELGKAPGKSLGPNVPYEVMQRREMEIKAKMLPLSHVEKTLIPSMASGIDARGGYVQKNNSCGDTKEEADFFAAWGQMVQKEYNDFITHQTHNIPIITSNVVSVSNNISGPVQFIDTENDEFHEISKVYMKPGSYKVPIKPADPIFSFARNPSEAIYDNCILDEMTGGKIKAPFSTVTLAPQPKYNIESWPCLMNKRTDDGLGEEQSTIIQRHVRMDMRVMGSNDILNSMNADCAWEAAKQSAPKLMDFIHEDSNSDTMRLYDALGLNNGNDDYHDAMKQKSLGLEQISWSINRCISKDVSDMWDHQSSEHGDLLNNQHANLVNMDGTTKFEGTDNFEADVTFDYPENKEIDNRDSRCSKFDQSGNHVRSENEKRDTKSKLTVSGTWYQPKKKKPLQNHIVKKFENILSRLSQIHEAIFIQHDMDMKVAPRFYDVVKYPMCLHDIATKLKNFAYTEQEQVVQDFRRIFDNVRLYLKAYPDQIMKKDVTKVSTEFEVMLTGEFHNKQDAPENNIENLKRENVHFNNDGEETASTVLDINEESNDSTVITNDGDTK